MSVTHQHHPSLDVLFSGCPTSNTKTLCIWIDLYENSGVGELRKICWYSMECICWLNGFKSPRVQGFKWASNHCVARVQGFNSDTFLKEWHDGTLLLAYWILPCLSNSKLERGGTMSVCNLGGASFLPVVLENWWDHECWKIQTSFN